MKKKSVQLKMYEQVCNELMYAFLDEYYLDGGATINDIDFYWIGSEPGGVLSVGDEFFGMDNIVDAMRYKPTRKQLFDFYYYELACAELSKTPDFNMKSFIAFKCELKDGKIILPTKSK